MDQLFMDLEKLDSVSGSDNFIHIISADGDKIIRISDLLKAITDGEFVKTGEIGRASCRERV